MNRSFSELVHKSERDYDARRIVEDAYTKMLTDVEQLMTFKKNEKSKKSDKNYSTGSTTAVLDPEITTTKGRKKQRPKTKFEKKRKAPATQPDEYIPTQGKHLL